MKRYFLLGFALLLMASSCIAKPKDAGQDGPLRLTLQFERSQYHVGEDVVAIVRLENVGDEAVLVNARMAVNLPALSSPIREITFLVLLPSGENANLDCFIDNRFIQLSDYTVLKPEEAIERQIYITSYCYRFTDVGIYRVTANYQNTIDPSYIDPAGTRVAWKGELNSEVTLLEIVP